MFKYTIVVVFALIATATAKPGLLAPLAYSAPLVAAPGVVTATSSQVIARNYNGIAATPVVAAAPVAASVVAAPLAARYLASAALAAPLAYSSPFAAAPWAYSTPLAAASLGYASAYGYASPLRYAAGAPLLL